jgi:hypothetical protein
MPSVRDSNSHSSPTELLNRCLSPAKFLAAETQATGRNQASTGTLRRRADVGGTALGADRWFRLRFVSWRSLSRLR